MTEYIIAIFQKAASVARIYRGERVNHGQNSSED